MQRMASEELGSRVCSPSSSIGELSGGFAKRDEGVCWMLGLLLGHGREEVEVEGMGGVAPVRKRPIVAPPRLLPAFACDP